MPHTDRPHASTDRTLLTHHAYRHAQPLTARQRLYDFQRPRYDLPGLVLRHLDHPHGTWADVGCGTGLYLDRIRSERPQAHVLGLDLSVSLLAALEGARVCADAALLPLRTGSVDVVLAMHMLYHLNDPDRALAEAARVLKPVGSLVVSTNSRHDKQELDELWARAAARVLGEEQGPRRVKLSARFAAEDAARTIGRHFEQVSVIDLDGVIEVDSPEPVLAHYASYRAWSHETGVPFEQTLNRVEDDLRVRLEEGPLAITTRQALIFAHRPRHDREAPAP